MTEFQKWIIETRESSEMSQIEFAEAVGVSPVSVTNWETGKKKPQMKNIVKLSRFSGVPYEDILGMVKDKIIPVEDVEGNPVASRIYRDGITGYLDHMNFLGMKSVFKYCETISKDPRFLNKDSRN